MTTYKVQLPLTNEHVCFAGCVLAGAHGWLSIKLITGPLNRVESDVRQFLVIADGQDMRRVHVQDPAADIAEKEGTLCCGGMTVCDIFVIQIAFSLSTWVAPHKISNLSPHRSHLFLRAMLNVYQKKTYPVPPTE